MKAGIEMNKAGFWIRLLATWIDCVFIYFVLKFIFYLFLFTSTNIYFPFNFTFFIVGIIYSVILITLKGQTIGKYFLGIKVYNKDGSKLSPVNSLLRESVLKILSGIVLFLGFFWIGFSRKKMGWHDYISQSKVLQNESQKRSTFFLRFLALISFILFFANYIWNFTGIIIDAKKMSLSPASVKLPFMERDPSTVKDVSLLSDSQFVNWLDKNAQTPEDYALQTAATHQITLFGEIHENADNLQFFNKIIEPLYFKSGIRVIAMEVIPASMNKKVDILVNGKTYDSKLALEIARSQCWKMWGFKEYWDVLETVWKLNRSLPKDAQRMMVVGLDGDWELPNISLLGLSQDSKGRSPFWEKFRFFSVIKDIPTQLYRDEMMARNIEREVIDKNQKAVVLIGFNHTLINYTNAEIKNNKIVAVKPRFGVLLSQKYKNKVFQIELFQRLDINEENIKCKSSIDAFLDSVMSKRKNQPVGFTIAASPFDKIRDSCSMFFTKFPAISYGDIAQGLIFLKPFNERKQCTWLKGYISDEMFMKYKPMYDLVFGKNPKIKFKNATELNHVLETWLGKE